MSRSLIGSLLFTFLVLLFMLLREERKKKAAKRANQLRSQGYVPITMDDAEPDVVTKSATAASRVLPGLFLALMVFLMAAVVLLAALPPLVKWILAGTLIALAAILVGWSLTRRRA